MNNKFFGSIVACATVGSFAYPSFGQAPIAPTPAAPPTYAPPSPPPAAEPPKEPPKEPQNKDEVPLIGKWTPKIYGLVQMNAVEDTTQSFNLQAGNTKIARPGTYAGEHSRLTMSAQHSRIGFKFGPGEGD